MKPPANNGGAPARGGAALPWIGLALRIAAAAIWIFAGAAKVPDLQGFRAEVTRYGIVPDFLIAPFASVLPFLEMGLGLYFALGLFVRGAAFVGSLLFAAFLFAQAWALANGIVLDCGCFGPVRGAPWAP